MDKINELVVGEKYSNDTIMKTFKVANSGGIRFSRTTQSLVIFSFHQVANKQDVPYQDFWQKNTLHYTGQGRLGNQELTRNNQKILNAKKNMVSIHLFETFVKGEHIYRGRVFLSEKPYTLNEIDGHHNERLVYKFPLTLIDSKSLISDYNVQLYRNNQQKAIKRLSLNRVTIIAKENSRLNHELHRKNPNNLASSRSVKTLVFERNLYVAQYVKQLSKGICALCDQSAPFLDKDNQPFLHAHHINYLSDGGEDIIENCIAVCPNCHAKIHSLNDPNDKEKLLKKVANR